MSAWLWKGFLQLIALFCFKILQSIVDEVCKTSMVYSSKLNYHFCLAGTFTTIRVTILADLTANANRWLEKQGRIQELEQNQAQIKL